MTRRRNVKKRLREIEEQEYSGDEPPYPWMAQVPESLWSEDDTLAAWRYFVELS